jgi:hypothetical protein
MREIAFVDSVVVVVINRIITIIVLIFSCCLGTPAADVPASAGLDGYNASRKATLTLDLDERHLAVAGRDSIIRVFAYGPPSPPSPQGSPASLAGPQRPSSSSD